LRIEERFKTFANAFQFFDLNANNRVSFNEFSKGLEFLKVKLNMKDQMSCFKQLDTISRGYITYDDFCALTRERRMRIDPGKEMIE
jgi:Ca2+-binding EF-hand superfamily protein